MEGLLPAVHEQSGQSLVELVAALAIILIVLLSLAMVGMVSIKNADLARQKALATKYAQEGIEKVRAYRDQNTWAVFSGACSNLGATLNLPALPNPLTRTIVCSDSGGGKLKVIATVSWTDTKGIAHNSKIITNFTDQSLW